MPSTASSTTTFSTFLFTDIEGSSLRWLSHRAAMQEAVARHDALVREAVAQYRGEIFKTAGDAFFISFKRPANAVTAAVAAQRRLIREDWSAVNGLKVRMALHLGSARQRGGDYFGPAVNRAARLLELGRGGQVLATASMAEVLAAEREGDALEKVGECPLDDPAQSVDIYQVVAKDLPREFPGLQISRRRRAPTNTGAIPPLARQGLTHATLVSILVALVMLAAGWFLFARSHQLNASASGASTSRSIAVLAFADLTEGEQNELLSDGVSEELINMLSKVPELKVAARSSSFSFKGKNTQVQEIAKRLGVAYIVEGSVRKSGNRIRVTVQLINAADGFQIWSDNYDRAEQDVFLVQDEIAAAITSHLKLELATRRGPSGMGRL
jgi:TolB-like protein/class 3 adenylate cyclase